MTRRQCNPFFPIQPLAGALARRDRRKPVGHTFQPKECVRHQAQTRIALPIDSQGLILGFVARIDLRAERVLDDAVCVLATPAL